MGKLRFFNIKGRLIVSCKTSNPLPQAASLAFLILFGTLPLSLKADPTTYSGDQSAGVVVASPPTFTAYVNSLTGAITPGSGVNGITLNNGSAGDVTINAGVSGTPIVINTSGVNGRGISISSVGTPSAPGTDPFLQVQIPTSTSVSGGVVTVNSFSNITTTGNLGYGIAASSSTTGYPSSVIDSLNSFISGTKSATYTFKVTQVSGSGTNIGTAVNASLVTLLSGTADGSFTTSPAAGDKLTLNSNGTYTFTPGGSYASLAVSGTMYVGVNFAISGTSPSSTSSGTDSGTLVVKIVKTGTGAGAFTASTFTSSFNTFGASATVFPDLNSYVQSLINIAGVGGSGNSVNVVNSGSIHTSGTGSAGIYATSQGSNGGNGRDASILHSSTQGGNGSTGGAVNVTANGIIVTGSTQAPGVLAWSLGGSGGKGGDSGYTRNSKKGGDGAQGGTVTVDGNGTITTTGSSSVGILAVSQGGNGGSGGAGSTFNSADDGGEGGSGGAVHVSGSWNITTSGAQAYGIWAKSTGGVAGGGGDGGWTGTSAGSGGQGTAGGDTFVLSNGIIITSGSAAHGIYSESIGGFGGSGGDGTSIFYSAGGSGASAGSGGNASGTNGATGVIITHGAFANGLFVESIGGGGGYGGSGGGAIASLGGGGSTGGNGGSATAANYGSITVTGTQAHGIFAQSVGGGGGDGGDSAGLVAIGGNGSATSAGGAVKVINSGSISSTSNAILAQSIGGGGGNGGSSGGWFSFGGSGGGGGDGGTVAVTSNGNLSTSENNASAIFAQSVGGGGGNGGNSTAVGAFVSVAIGGGGAKGGNAGKVTVGVDTTDGTTIDPVTGIITTLGNNANGIQAQSVGGGGGAGGFAVSASGGTVGSVSIGIGGSGGAGGSAGEADVYFGGTKIQTGGDNSNGIFAQSVGGGGGSGGFSIAVSFSAGPTGAFSLGGSGGLGGNASTVNVGSAANPTGGQIITTGNHSSGILAQSVGGGGGNGGFSVAGTLTVGPVGGALSIGGSGTSGGSGSNVTVYSNSSISTTGSDSHGIFAQSVGGGGGAGGASVSAVASTGGAVGLSFGGAGGSGNSAGNVTVVSNGDWITTTGDRSDGILAQSVGGGGGAGGLSVAGGISGGPTLNFSMGGSGGTGASAGTVSVSGSSNISTSGTDSHGIFAQSVGGGGGAGGFSVAAGISFSPVGGSAALNASVGGSGGTGANASDVTVVDSGTAIFTTGRHSYGILAQSVGGGGGDGGFSVAGGISNGPTVSFSMGGSGANGGNAGNVQVLNSSYISTEGENSHGLFAQSVGGGGGSGGFSITGNISSSAGVGVSLGGSGAGGGNSGNVAVGATITGTSGGLPTFTASPVTGGIFTSGNRSYGILAQSIGGSGGDGGFSIAGGITASANVNFSMGGNGGNGGSTGDVVVDSASAIFTTGTNSHGIFAQSLGGGGGSGGFSVTGGISVGSAAVGASIGGNGSSAGNGKTVQVISTGTAISTTKDQSDGILAQSVGGGGGAGGFSVAGNISDSAAVGFSMGGSGAGGGTGSTVSVSNSSIISTQGNDSFGILAQSLGGGGGAGGFSVAGGISASSAAIDASIGGKGGGGGASGNVVLNSGSGIYIQTTGNRSTALLAQSIGGGGGAGGFSVAAGLSNSQSVNFSLGGSGGSGGSSGTVTLSSTSAIFTSGTDSHGILAQSVGGGGGIGGFSIAGGISVNGAAVSVSLGGNGGGGGNGNTVNVTSSGTLIMTGSNHSDGILAQSIGGGGGDGGFSVVGNGSGGDTGAVGFSMGGSGTAAGSGGAVTVINSSIISTEGNDSFGILAQSLGGGGGSGGFSVTGGIATTGTTVDASVGGKAGGGGGAGNVILTDTGLIIMTQGDRSSALVAQSIGGGGGSGGFSVAGGISQSTSVNFSMGGKGGAGGSAGTVTLSASSTIITGGTNSHGILAQSVGGGGGNGGFSVAAGITTGTQAAASVNASVGGYGGVAGSGSSVNVTSSGSSISTAGFHSYGILAQSVGGGGGDGGFSVAGGISQSPTVDFSLGGSAGAAGNGGIVNVDSSSNIITTGNNAYGIFAQSLGGGGGSGGFSVAGGISKGTTAITVSIGGSGGAGGSANTVTVGNNGVITGTISTSGTGSSGIVAESIGGGGGDGGFSIAGSIATQSGTGTKSIAVSIGGGGGDGGYSGDVAVNSAAVIMTGTDNSNGILAHTLGGGGGDGGFSVAGALSMGSGSDNTSVSLTVAVGGGGGDGNYAGSATVTNSGNISTMGNNSDGISAYSVGGGGGNGGSSLGVALGVAANSPGKNLLGNFSIGGGGGDGNNGGVVTVNNTGNIVTLGDQSDGIYAQSVGGGGGNGGTARTFTMLADDLGSTVANFPLIGKYLSKSDPGSQGNNFELTLAVGGSGGGASSGTSVIVSSTANISTQGEYSHGIFAQSIGGGGGNGGDGLFGTGTYLDLVTIFDNSAIYKNISIAIGGNAGSNGNGGNVNVTQSGTITTQGLMSDGIFAQSIGGGGGVSTFYAEAHDDNPSTANPATGGNSAIGLTGKVGIGGAGGAAGNGGVIIVNSTGAIFTSGNGANGIFAQSVGGGGGVAGSVDRSLKDYLNVGLGIAYGRDGGGGGNGGDVTVSSTSNIITTGNAADGIFAQSVGGGGGEAGGLGIGLQNIVGAVASLFQGSVGGSGTSGVVTVTQQGNIFTSGSDSNGIFAQSAAGTDKAQNVTVTLTSGTIGVSGINADGIFAQSLSGSGNGVNGNVAVTITGGIVQGGYGASAGIHIMDGSNNTLTNHGTVQALGLLSGSSYTVGGTNVSVISGTAILGGTMNETVDNFGVVNGSVDLSSGTNTFNHNTGALLQSGSVVFLGTGNNFNNSGYISPGGINMVETTAVTGNFIQTGSADWLFDITPAITSDLWAISGTANLGSYINTVNLNEIGIPTTTGTFTLITAPSGLTGNFKFGTYYGGTMPIGLTYTLVNSDTQEQLSLAISTGPFYWRGAVDSVWNSAFVNGESNFTSDIAGNNFIYGTPGSLVDVFFSSTNPATANINTTLGADFSINSLTVSDTNAISIGGSNSLTIFAAGGTGITVDAGAGTATLSMANLVLAADQSWTNDSILNVISPTITGSGKNLTVQGSGTTNITSVIATGSGSLTKDGSGTLVLFNANTYSGGSFMKNGNLIVANENALGTGNVNFSRGILRTVNESANPPTTPLHLNVGANFIQGVPAALVLRIIGPTGVNDSLFVAGNAILTGAFVPDYSVAGYTPVPPDGKYTDAFNIIHTGGVVAGKFTSFIDVHYDPNKLLRWEPFYSPHDVMLEWVQYSASAATLAGQGIILTPDQNVIANAINLQMGLPAGGGPVPYNQSTGPAVDAHPGLAAAFNFLNNEPLKNLPADYDLISPDQLSSIFSVGNALADVQGSNVENRLWEIRNGGGSGFSATGFNLQNDHGSVSIATLAFTSPTGTGDKIETPAADSKDGKSTMRYKTELRPASEHDPRWGMFITGGGEFAHVGHDFNANGYDFTTGGITVGADFHANEHFAVGIMGGFANTDTRLNNHGSIRVNSGNIGLYSTLYGSGFYMNTLVAGGYNNYNSHRTALGGAATGNTSGGELDTLISGGYDAHFGKLTVGPVASAQYTYVEINDFTETGSLLPVRVPTQNQQSFRTKVGLKASYDLKTTSGIVITPMATASWQHEYLNSGFALDASFAQGAGDIFDVRGPAIGRDSAIFSVGINVQWTTRFGTYLNYDGEFGRRNYQINTVSGGAKLNF